MIAVEENRHLLPLSRGVVVNGKRDDVGHVVHVVRGIEVPDPYAQALKYVIIALGVIGVLCVVSVFTSRYSRRERLRKKMDIIENTDE